jgi:prolyl-tRNA editing enzyme YbaK/EbsC (Cys-tRNA(Pro) deacylase)
MSSTARVEQALAERGESARIVTFDQSTRTSEDAAAAIGCTVGQIAKSLIFRAKASDRPVLVIACGDNRVDEKRLRAALGEKVGRADADFVRDRTGFAIGVVAPVGHVEPVPTILDADLWRHDIVWAAAGAPNAVFETTPDALLAMTSGERADIAKG